MSVTNTRSVWSEIWVNGRGLLALYVLDLVLWLFHDDDRDGLSIALFTVLAARARAEKRTSSKEGKT